MKKGIVFLVLVIIIASGVFAQGTAKNSVSGGLMVGLFSGISVDYERVLIENFLGNGKFAIGAEAAFGVFILSSLFYADVQAKWYPWSRMFYADLGIGFGNLTVLIWSVPTLVIPIGVGWKIDIGKPDGWFVDIGAGLDYLLFLDSAYTSSSDSGLPINPRATVQMGYSF